MKIKDYITVNLSEYGIISTAEVKFLRVYFEDLSITLGDIFEKLKDLSWLNKFNKDFLRKSYRKSAQITINNLTSKLKSDTEDIIIKEAGEYLVSSLSKQAIVETINHLDVPLMELLGRKKSGNPGFDFYTEDNSEKILFCGEAKYQKNSNAYSSSLKQINNFIVAKKHIMDIKLLNELVDDTSLDNLSKGVFGISAAFSSTSINTETLIHNITSSSDFNNILSYEKIILVAVDIIWKT